MKTLRLIPVAVALLTLGVSANVTADDHAEEPTLHDVWMVVPKAGKEAEFAEAAAAHMAYRAENGDSRSWYAYRPVTGSKLNAVLFRTCCFHWSDLDDHVTEDAEKGFGAHWNANVHPYVKKYNHMLEEHDMENSHWPDGSNGPYYGVTTWDRKENAGPASGQAREAISQTLKDDGWASDSNNWMWLFPVNGSPQTVLVSSYGSYAEMKPPEVNAYDAMVEAVGEEEAGRLFSEFGSAYHRSDYTIWRHDETLSTPNAE